jgi:hypothetical protein
VLFRFLLYVLFFYILWRVLRGVLKIVSGPSTGQRPAPKPRRPGDLSDVEEADFEDITPPPDKNSDSSTTTSST